MEKSPTLFSSVRLVRKLRLFAQRSKLGDGEVICELCNKAPATDLHEILNRVHYSAEMLADIPDVLLSCLCNDCNVNKADTREARLSLLKKNLVLYGFREGHEAIQAFSDKLGRRAFAPSNKFNGVM